MCAHRTPATASGENSDPPGSKQRPVKLKRQQVPVACVSCQVRKCKVRVVRYEFVSCHIRRKSSLLISANSLVVRRAETQLFILPTQGCEVYIRDRWRFEAGRPFEKEKHGVDREMQWFGAATYLPAIMQRPRSCGAFATSAHW